MWYGATAWLSGCILGIRNLIQHVQCLLHPLGNTSDVVCARVVLEVNYVWCDPLDFLRGQRDAFGIVGQNQVNKNLRRIGLVCRVSKILAQIFYLAFEFRNALLKAFGFTHFAIPFVRLVCTSNDACNRDVRKARVACATAAGFGALLADDNTDRGAGDLQAAPTSTTPCWTWARGGVVRHVPLFRGGGS